MRSRTRRNLEQYPRIPSRGNISWWQTIRPSPGSHALSASFDHRHSFNMKTQLTTALLCLAALTAPGLKAAEDLVVSDFESEGYGGWKSTGDAFGKGPAQGALQATVDLLFRAQRFLLVRFKKVNDREEKDERENQKHRKRAKENAVHTETAEHVALPS